MGEFSLTHLLLVAVIFLLFFGPSRLPQLGQSLGRALRGFKEGLNEVETSAKDISQNNQQAPRPSQQQNLGHQGQNEMPQAQEQKEYDKKS